MAPRSLYRYTHVYLPRLWSDTEQSIETLIKIPSLFWRMYLNSCELHGIHEVLFGEKKWRIFYTDL